MTQNQKMRIMIQWQLLKNLPNHNSKVKKEIFYPIFPASSLRKRSLQMLLLWKSMAKQNIHIFQEKGINLKVRMKKKRRRMMHLHQQLLENRIKMINQIKMMIMMVPPKTKKKGSQTSLQQTVAQLQRQRITLCLDHHNHMH